MELTEISRFVDESKGYLAKGDAVQASEKLYKAAEQCIKILAERHELPEYKKAEEEWAMENVSFGPGSGQVS